MVERPNLKEFRIEDSRDGIVHLVFDMPGRKMNVFSNSAIADIGLFAAWLKGSDARGCVVRSGKTTAFCAGADLPEIEAAYEMIEAAPLAEREKRALDHFTPLGANFRALETVGKPVVAAIDGLALGGGCELALACHARIMTTSKNAQLGLPESLVGLLPGAGGTQRLPRLVDMETALRVLLDGGRLNAAQALEKGLVVALVAPGHEIEAAEQWILQSTDARQPWDKAGSAGKSEAAHARIARERQARRRLPNGHYPAPLAILDCIEGGLDAPMDQALAHEMTVFSRLIQRPEPRAMIRALFMGRLDHDRLAAKGALPRQLQAVLEHASIGLERACEVARAQGVDEESIARARNFAGFAAANSSSATGNEEADARDADGYWFESPGATAIESLAAAMIFGVAGAVKDDLDGLQQMEINAVDYVASSQIQFPAYLGGPLALARRVASHGAA